MRRLFLVLALAACHWGSSPPDARATVDAAACGPSGSCGGASCGVGEACVEGVCMCGTNPACAVGDMCAAPGPVGGDGCGSICCGASGPCPQ
jgi:hypothetical protein